eukprot:5263103-Pleurochrysis_carterae.AAC.1
MVGETSERQLVCLLVATSLCERTRDSATYPLYIRHVSVIWQTAASLRLRLLWLGHVLLEPEREHSRVLAPPALHEGRVHALDQLVAVVEGLLALSRETLKAECAQIRREVGLAPAKQSAHIGHLTTRWGASDTYTWTGKG